MILRQSVVTSPRSYSGDTRAPSRATRAWLLAQLFLLVVLVGAVRAADKIEDLSRVLLEDPSYKLRVQAALLLGKLGDSRGASALEKALFDTHKTVRAMAAQSLGKLGAMGAAPALQVIAQRERDPFVKSHLQKALAALALRREPPVPVAVKIVLTLGSFTGGVRTADGSLIDVFRSALRRELGKLASVAIAADGASDKSAPRGGPAAFLIDGSVTRMDAGMLGDSVEISCDVKVMVARWPTKSVVLWMSAGASVHGGSRDRDKQIARRDCLEASAGQLGEDLGKFFVSQGG